MKILRRLAVWTATVIIVACGADSDSSSNSGDKYAYCQTTTEAEGGYQLVLCREYLNLSKADRANVIAMCDENDTGDFQEEQQCPENDDRLGGCTAEEDGLDVTLWFYKDYTASEAETACSTDFEGDWAVALHGGKKDIFAAR